MLNSGAQVSTVTIAEAGSVDVELRFRGGEGGGSQGEGGVSEGRRLPHRGAAAGRLIQGDRLILTDKQRRDGAGLRRAPTGNETDSLATNSRDIPVAS